MLSNNSAVSVPLVLTLPAGSIFSLSRNVLSIAESDATVILANEIRITLAPNSMLTTLSVVLALSSLPTSGADRLLQDFLTVWLLDGATRKAYLQLNMTADVGYARLQVFCLYVCVWEGM